MKIISSFILIVFGSVAAEYANQPGKCKPFEAVDLIVDLIYKEARELVDPAERPLNKKVYFDLYTRKNPVERQRLRTADQRGLLQSNFNAAWPVR